MSNKISIQEFEAKVLDIEEIVIVVRGAPSAKVDDYDYERQAAHTMSLSDWLKGRINPKIGDFHCAVIDGSHNTRPHGKTKLSTLRESYEN